MGSSLDLARNIFFPLGRVMNGMPEMLEKEMPVQRMSGYRSLLVVQTKRNQNTKVLFASPKGRKVICLSMTMQ